VSCAADIHPWREGTAWNKPCWRSSSRGRRRLAGGGWWIGIWPSAIEVDGPVFSCARLSTTTAGCWRWRKSDGTWPVAPGTPIWSIGGIAGQFSTPACPFVGSYSIPSISKGSGSGVRLTGGVS